MKRLSQIIFLVCVILTLLFIWVNSMLPGDLSGMESAWVQKLVQPVLDFIYSGRIQAGISLLAVRLPGQLGAALLRLAETLDEKLPYLYPSILVRKAAHFSEYALLGFFMGLLFVRRDGRSRFFLPALACLTAAAIDESIQLFVSGRAGQVRDVCIDMCGALSGLAIALTVLAVARSWYRARSPGFGKN